MNRTIAISDIHGHYDQLLELMSKLCTKYNASFEKDTFVFLGDYIDGGPDSKKVVQWLIDQQDIWPHWQILYGNHEDLMLDALDPKHPIYGDFYLWWNQGGRETTESYKKDSEYSDYEKSLLNPIHIIPVEHRLFLEKLPTYYEDEKYFYCHGGPHSYHTLEWCKANWGRTNFIWARDFIHSNFKWEKKIIFGHTIQYTSNPKTNLQPWIMDNKIGIDTFMHNQGRLTAIILPEEIVVQSEYTSNAAEHE